MKRLICAAILSVLLTSQAVATDANTLVEAGNKLWSEGQLEQAESTFREAIELDSGAALPHARLAGLLLSQNRNDEARTEYQNAIINDPEDPQLFLALAIVYLHEKSYSNAQTMVDAALELDPELENALKLQSYMTSKTAMLEDAAATNPNASVAVPQDTIHDSTPTGSTDSPH
jgi:tetratricopeptide (TPR) repeat protein